MKKSILILSLLAYSFGYSQVLEEENFNSYPYGTVSDWNVTGSVLPVLEVVPLNGEKVLKVTVPYNHMPNSVTVKKNQNFQDLWNNRQAGNNVLKGEVDILNLNVYTTGQIGIFDTNNNPIVGISAGSVFSNGPIYGFARVVRKSDNTITMYSVMLRDASSDPIKISYTYNYETGEVTWKTPTNTYILNSSDPQYNIIPNQNIKENKIVLDLIHMSGATITIDNYKIEAIPTAVLNTSEHAIKNNKISIYPNPSKDYINIKSTNIKSIEIIDMTGKLIERPQASSKINVSGLLKGNYLMKVMTSDGVYTEKFIKE